MLAFPLLFSCLTAVVALANSLNTMYDFMTLHPFFHPYTPQKWVPRSVSRILSSVIYVPLLSIGFHGALLGPMGPPQAARKQHQRVGESNAVGGHVSDGQLVACEEWDDHSGCLGGTMSKGADLLMFF